MGRLRVAFAVTVALSGALALDFGVVPSAHGAVGSRLDAFVPSPARNGRAVAISGSTAYISSQYERINQTDLRSKANVGYLETLGAVSSGFGALDFDSAGALWGSRYTTGSGEIYRIDLGKSTIEEVFDAFEIDPENEGIDGFAVDADGSLWVSGEGLEEGGGPTTTTVYQVGLNGEPGNWEAEVLDQFSVPFGNSGIEVWGDHLWLADIGGERILQYDKGGNATGLEFPTGEFNGDPVEAEDLAVDRCTFPGKLALWTYGAHPSAGPLVAYEIGTNPDTTGCPQPPPPPPANDTGSGNTGGDGPGSSPGPTDLRVGGGAGGARAGQPAQLVAVDANDPTGRRFTYIWSFGDGRRLRGGGRVRHRYRCAGIYRVKVIQIDGTGARHVFSKRFAVGFPRSATKRYRGLRFGPKVRIAGRKAIAWLRWVGRGRGVRTLWVDWKLDRQRGRHIPSRNRVIGRIKRRRNHRLRASVRFSDGRRVTIRTCFYA